jgi:threonine aldolase
MAGRLAESIALSGSARLALEPDGNEVFAIVGKRDDARLRGFGAVYHPWPADGFAGLVDIGADECVIRLVTSFQTTAEDVDRFAALL